MTAQNTGSSPDEGAKKGGCMNAFHWKGRPSVFAQDRAFMAQGDKGLSLSQSAQQRHTTGLVTPVTKSLSSGISIAPRDRDTGARNKKLKQARI
jgi:hypothetical protein